MNAEIAFYATDNLITLQGAFLANYNPSNLEKLGG
jgi:hypothetical protein